MAGSGDTASGVSFAALIREQKSSGQPSRIHESYIGEEPSR
jgi:hypothetical protein